MSVSNNLYLQFGKKNCLLLVTYLIVVLIAFPLEGIFLPRQYTKMVKNLTENSNKIAHVFTVIILVLMVTTALSAIRNTIRIELFPKRLMHFTREEMYNHMVDRYSTDFKQVKPADVIQRINGISKNLTHQAEWVGQEGAPLILSMIVIIAYFFIVNKTIGLIATVGFLINAATTASFGSTIRARSIARERTFIETSQKISNNLNNLKNIYINSQGDKNKGDVQLKNEEHANLFQDELLLGRNMKIVVTTITLITLLCVVYYLYKTLFGKKGSTPEQRFEAGAIILVYMTYMTWMNELFMNMPYAFHRQGVIHASDNFLKDIFSKRAGGNKKTGISLGRIEFKNVSFAFDKKDIIKNESYVFESGKLTCIKGRSGSGKSVTAHLIVALYTPDKGDIYIDGVNLKEYDRDYLRKMIVYCNQDSEMFENTIRYNILYGNPGKEAELNRILDTYNLKSLYNTVGGIDKKTEGENLSAGMKKVIMVLRCILKDKASIYIFDEPTAGLDERTTKNVLELIQNESKGRTVILITHSDTVSALCHKNILFSK